MEVAITRISSKGQVVIPSNMRKGLKEGDKLIVMKDKDNFILKKASSLDKNFAEDLEFARRTEEAFNRIKSGEGIKMDMDEFLEELKKW